MTGSAFPDMLEVAEACMKCRCGCCKDECPMYSEMLEETISPKGRNILIRGLSKGVLEPDERAMRIAYSCLLCRRDELSCSAKLKNADATEMFREYLLSRGMPLLPEHEMLVKSLENYGNPWQEPKSARKRWVKGLDASKAVPRRTDTLFYVGCTFALDRTLQESPRALVSLMKKAGEGYGLLLEDEVCCGSTVKRLGHSRLYDKLRRENDRRLRSIEAKRIVTACSGCFKTLKQDYPGLTKDVEVLHATEYLDSLVKEGKLRPGPLPMKVTYHDPCHLGRHAEVYDAPRRVLASIPGLELIEMKSSRELARCCGGGAGVKTAYPEISLKVAVRRLKEAERTGAAALVTACPFCVQSLRSAASSTSSKLEVTELSVLLDRAVRDNGGIR